MFSLRNEGNVKYIIIILEISVFRVKSPEISVVILVGKSTHYMKSALGHDYSTWHI
jgi:hypothetical protein